MKCWYVDEAAPHSLEGEEYTADIKEKTENLEQHGSHSI
jgi:hypothetical protein